MHMIGIRCSQGQTKNKTKLEQLSAHWQPHMVTELQVISWLIGLLYYIAALKLLENSFKTNPCLVENCTFH